MRVWFLFPRPKHYDSTSVRRYPSGGTEKATVFLAEALGQLGFNTYIATTLSAVEQALADIQAGDVVIAQEAEYFQHLRGARCIWWSHHFSDQPISARSAPFVRCFADAAVTLSQCHHDDIRAAYRLESVVIGHGVFWGEIKIAPKQPNSYIYASTPFRGLHRLPESFNRIKQTSPDATLHVCSSMQTYGADNSDTDYRAVFDELELIEGVILHGALNQDELYSLYAQAETFLYPCTWPETYCLALDEAIAHCCKLEVEPLAALAERIDGYMPKDWAEVAKDWEKVITG